MMRGLLMAGEGKTFKQIRRDINKDTKAIRRDGKRVNFGDYGVILRILHAANKDYPESYPLVLDSESDKMSQTAKAKLEAEIQRRDDIHDKWVEEHGG